MKSTNQLKSLAFLCSLACTGSAFAWDVITQHQSAKVESYYGQAVNNLDNHDGDSDPTDWLPTSIEYNKDTGGYSRFMVAMVRCTGAHYRKWKFMYDTTPQSISNWGNTNGYTVVDLERYIHNGSTKYAALLYKKPTFENYFMYTTTDFGWLNGYTQGTGGRVVDMDLDEEGIDRIFGVVNFNTSVTNTHWNFDMAWGDVATYRSNYHMRVLNLQQKQNGKYVALFCSEKQAEVGKTTYFGMASWVWVRDWPAAHGWRVQTINRRVKNGVSTFSGTLVKN